MTDTELDEIEKRANAATPGPWLAMAPVREPRRERQITAPRRPTVAMVEGIDPEGTANALFIESAICDVPNLVAEVRRLRTAARAVLAHWTELGPEHGFDEVVGRLARELLKETTG